MDTKREKVNFKKGVKWIQKKINIFFQGPVIDELRVTDVT